MDPERWREIKRRFDAVIALEPARRSAWLRESCQDDDALRRQVEAMLAADSDADSGPLERSMLAGPEPATPHAGDLPSLGAELSTANFASAATRIDPDEVPDPQHGPDKYEVRGFLGAGGMGQVYLAWDQDLGREVAVKIAATGSESGAARLFREARILARLDHPCIVPVYEVGLTRGRRLYYAMPVVGGESLAEILVRLRAGEASALAAWSLLRRVELLIQVGQAMAYAHARGVVHRDLKPANIMLGSHGEVLVLDWGLSAALADDAVGAEGRNDPARADGALPRRAGTPAYMSPEQARGEGADGRSDIWALGVILYELLSLSRPFAGESPEALLQAILTHDPEPPRRRAPGLHVPPALEEICLRALCRDAGERFATAEDMVRALHDFLEAEADRGRRSARAEEKASEGRRKMEVLRTLAQAVRAAESAATEVEERLPGWLPAAEKGELLAAWSRREQARTQQVRAAADVIRTLESALEIDDSCAPARELLAGYYRDRMLEAEAGGEVSGRDFFAERVAAYHDGKYARELEGGGTLALESLPGGAEVRLQELVEDGFVLRPGLARELGRTPVGPIPLAMGSYLVTLALPGHREVRYPVFIARNGDWRGSVRLRHDEEIGRGLCYVPAGPFRIGGDPEAMHSLPGGEADLSDFAIGAEPVTMAEYLEFLNDIAARDGLAAAEQRSPRTSGDAPSRLVRTADRRLALPLEDAEGDRWSPARPVFGISRDDAAAYCAWRSRREGRAYRLPSELEWEKAARGVDGRAWPWGNRFDPSLCNMKESHREGTRVVDVDRFPDDVSVYGVRGMAGNVRDWTSTVDERASGAGRTLAIGRGGAWHGDRRHARCASRGPRDARSVDDNWGFRVVVSLR